MESERGFLKNCEMLQLMRTVELLKLAIQMKEKSTAIKRRKYDASFKEEVMKMVFNGRGVSEIAQSLGIGENLIYRWKSRYQKQHVVSAPLTAAIATTEEQQALHRRIKELETERDILKKALGIFSRQT